MAMKPMIKPKPNLGSGAWPNQKMHPARETTKVALIFSCNSITLLTPIMMPAKLNSRSTIMVLSDTDLFFHHTEIHSLSFIQGIPDFIRSMVNRKPCISSYIIFFKLSRGLVNFPVNMHNIRIGRRKNKVTTTDNISCKKWNENKKRN